jgi:PAS domain S-box-containing protein
VTGESGGKQKRDRRPDRSPDTRPVRVLVVDDDPHAADITAELLERSAAVLSVAVAGDARTGLDRLEDERFDCVVSGHEMPDMDGIEFLEAVRRRRPEFPFVLFVGEGSEDLASRAITAGVTDYVQRKGGTDHYELLARQLRSAVDERRAEREVPAPDHIDRTVRRTVREALRAGSRPGIQRTVCETLADADPYRFAWTGTVENDRIVPSAWAGVERGYLDDITVTADRAPTGRGPAGRAVRTGEPQAVRNVGEAPEFEPWREAAEHRGYASVATVPLACNNASYGLLNVYTDRPAAFDERELNVLSELGEIVARAIHRIELTDRVVDQYETLFEESPVMTVTTREEDGDPVIENCNRRFLEALGYDRSAVTGRPLDEFYTSESSAQLFDEGGYDRALTDRFAREERTLVTADGDTVETLLCAIPRQDRSGEAFGTFALYVDVSEQRRLQRENERLDEFASIVSHDLRNPLTVIKGRARLAGEQYDSEDVEAVLDAAERMEELINDILTLARQGKTVEGTEPVALADTVRDCWNNVETNGASLDVRTNAVVRADESRLQQLLENLFRNAVEHGSTSPPSHAHEDAVEHDSTSDRPDGDGLTVAIGGLEDGGFYVADDGVGVPSDERPDVFEPGYTGRSDNTGFGLSIVAEIAEAHGWELTLVESTDGGARFEVAGVERI